MKHAHNFIDRTGQRFGRLLVIEFAGKSEHRKTKWRVKCDCGNEKTVFGNDLVTNRTESCGCLNQELGRARATHGMSNHPLSQTWYNIVNRCTNPNAHDYARYGARGISLCSRWHSIENFIADIERLIGPRPPGCSIDRKDNDGDYEPGNVRWATTREQAANTKYSKLTGVQLNSRGPRSGWRAEIRVKGDCIYLGTFPTEEEASMAYRAAADLADRELRIGKMVNAYDHMNWRIHDHAFDTAVRRANATLLAMSA